MSRWKVVVMVIVLLMLVASTASSQWQFARALDNLGAGPQISPSRIIRTSDGGYAVLGESYDCCAGDMDLVVLKTDDVGYVQWATCFGWEQEEWPAAIVEDDAGGLLIAAFTASVGAGQEDILLVKLDPAGNVLGSKTLGWESIDRARDLVRTADGGYALLGDTDLMGGDLLFIKLNGAADPQYSQVLELSTGGDAVGRSLMQTTDYGYALLAYAHNDVVLCKLNVSGGHVWTWRYSGNVLDFPESFVQTEDDGWVIAGATISFGADDRDILLMRISNFGALVWGKIIGGTDLDAAFQVIRATNAYAVAGYTHSFGARTQQAFLAQFDAVWNLTSFWIVGNSVGEQSSSVVRATLGGCVTVGRSATYGADIAMVKYDNNGETCIGESIVPTTTIVYPESQEHWMTITYVGPTLLYHEAIVLQLELADETICRDTYVCGDADFNGAVDIDDAVYIVQYIFGGGPAPDPPDAGDVDCSGGVDIDDVVYLVAYIFLGGYAPCDTDGDGIPDC